MNNDSASSVLSIPAEAAEIRYVVMNEGREVPARIFECSAGRELADLHGIDKDLEHVIWCCETICQINDQKILKALFDSAVIRYRRCFNKGIRRCISLQEVEKLGDYFLENHNYFILAANKSVAHSANITEILYPVLFYDDFLQEIISHGTLNLNKIGETSDSINRLKALAQIVKNNLVANLISEIGDEYDKAVVELNLSTASMLPEAIMPVKLTHVELAKRR